MADIGAVFTGGKVLVDGDVLVCEVSLAVDAELSTDGDVWAVAVSAVRLSAVDGSAGLLVGAARLQGAEKNAEAVAPGVELLSVVHVHVDEVFSVTFDGSSATSVDGSSVASVDGSTVAFGFCLVVV